MTTPGGPPEPWACFPKPASYRLDAMARAASLALTLALLSAPVFLRPLAVDHPQDGFIQGIFMAVAASCMLASTCIVRLSFNHRLEMGPHALVRHRLFASKPLRYTSISGLTAAHDVRRGSWRIEFLVKDGSEMVAFLDDEHLRDEALVAWLTSIPRHGGDAIVATVDAGGGGIAASAVSGILLAVSALACVFLTLPPASQARRLVEDRPALAQLDLTQGPVTRVDTCHRTGKGGVYLPVVVEADTGPQRIHLRCDLEPALRHGAWPHHVAVYRGTHLFDDAIRQVEIDGAVVQSYTDFDTVERHRAPFILVGETMLVAAAWVLLLGFAVSRLRRR